MPAEKTARKMEKRRLRNRQVRSATRTMVGKAGDALRSGSDAETEVGAAIKALDSAVTKGILHKNNAARKKSRLMAKLNASQAS